MKNESDESLPSGWARPTLSQLVEGAQSGFASGEKAVVNGLQHLRMNNIGEEGTLVLDLLRTVPPKLAKPQHKLKPNDVLVCTTNSGKLVGKCALFDQPGDFAFSNHITRLRPKEGVVDANYLRWSLWFAWKAGTYEELCQHWVNQSTLPKDLLMAVEIPLPPIAEQRQIMAKVESVLARVNAARDRLVKVPILLKRFRQSTLAAACSGKLTADWRARQGLIDESEEKPALWKERLLSDLCTGFNYGSSAKSAKDGLVPVLRMGNLQDGKLDWTDLAFTSDADEIKKYTLQPNTVLFNRTNSPELVGKTALYGGERPAVFAGYLIRIVHGNELDPHFLNFALNAPVFRDYCASVKTDGVSQSNINAKKLAAYPLNWCPFPEQREIVRRVEALFAVADKIEARVAAASARADKLIQSTLAKAFRGELVFNEDALNEAAFIHAQKIDEGLAVLYALALLYTWKASPDRRAFELGMVLMQKDGLRQRILKGPSAMPPLNTPRLSHLPSVGRIDEFIGELAGTSTISVTNRRTRQLIALGTNAPAKAGLLKDSVGKKAFIMADEAVRAVAALDELGQSLDQYSTADDYDTIEIAIS